MSYTTPTLKIKHDEANNLLHNKIKNQSERKTVRHEDLVITVDNISMNLCGESDKLLENEESQEIENELENYVEREVKAIEKTSETDLCLFECWRVKNPELSTIEGRAYTFYLCNWPQQIIQRPMEMARCGFYYYGINDHVCCYYCDIKVTNWGVLDKPLAVHRTNSPTCLHARLIQQEEDDKKRLAEEKINREDVGLVCSLFKKRKYFSDETTENLCLLCQEKRAVVVYKPCGHLSACLDCAIDHMSHHAKNFKLCLTCKEDITSTTKMAAVNNNGVCINCGKNSATMMRTRCRHIVECEYCTTSENCGYCDKKSDVEKIVLNVNYNKKRRFK